MNKLFKALPPQKKKSARFEIRFTQDEAKQIRFSALARNMSVSDFIRLAAQGRRADVKFNTEVILAILELVQAIREMHADLVARGMRPLDAELGQLMDVALDAMLRIDK